MKRQTKERITFNQLRRRYRHQFHVGIPCYRKDLHAQLILSMLRFVAAHQEEIRRG